MMGQEVTYTQNLEHLQSMPDCLWEMAQEIPESQFTWKPSPQEFSFLEQVCHLRDIEQEGYGFRIRKILTEDHPFLPDLDGGKLARERNYNAQRFDQAFREFSQARQENLDLLQKATPGELNRTGEFETLWTITLEKLVQMMCQHDQIHWEEIKLIKSKLVKL